MSEEEKQIYLNKKYYFPSASSHKESQYVDTVAKSSEVNTISTFITEQVERIKEQMDNDCRIWEMSQELRYVLGTRTERGKARLFKQDLEKNEDNPVFAYKRAIEELTENLSDIRHKFAQKTEQFISLESSLLKQTLLDLGNEYMTYILEHLKKDAKTDLNTLIDEMQQTVEELKQPSQKRDQLKKNKERYNEVRAKQHLLEARIEPIKKKFAFIQDDANSESTMTELSEEEKNKLASLDELWGRFLKGMTEANAVILRDYQTLKAEMDSSIEDFKKSVQENRANFKQSAPFAVEKAAEHDNIKALEKLQEFK